MSDVNTSRLTFMASELGYLPDGEVLQIKQHMVDMAESKYQGALEFCANTDFKKDTSEFCQSFISSSKNEAMNAHMLPEGAHIDALNESALKEHGIDVSQYTQDGVISRNDVVSMMIDVADLSGSASAVQVSQHNVHSAEAFLETLGVSDSFSSEDVKKLAGMDAVFELAEQQNREMLNSMGVEVGASSADIMKPQ